MFEKRGLLPIGGAVGHVGEDDVLAQLDVALGDVGSRSLATIAFVLSISLLILVQLDLGLVVLLAEESTWLFMRLIWL